MSDLDAARQRVSELKKHACWLRLLPLPAVYGADVCEAAASEMEELAATADFRQSVIEDLLAQRKHQDRALLSAEAQVAAYKHEILGWAAQVAQLREALTFEKNKMAAGVGLDGAAFSDGWNSMAAKAHRIVHTPAQAGEYAGLPQWLTDPENQPNQYGVRLVNEKYLRALERVASGAQDYRRETQGMIPDHIYRGRIAAIAKELDDALAALAAVKETR